MFGMAANMDNISAIFPGLSSISELRARFVTIGFVMFCCSLAY